ncbi:MAG: transposase [Massilibacteroides sp.]|jgi:transposase|nr:transposase [Massilibacteroides sp.]
MGKRTRYTAEFKAKVALAALKEQETISELVHRFGVSAMTISKWKQDFLINSSKVFEGESQESKDDREEEVQKLHATIGRLTVERDFLADACKRAGLKKK